MENNASTAERLRSAIACESWAEARRLLPDYLGDLGLALDNAASGGPEAPRLLAEARELFDWARRMALISRAHNAARLEELGRASRYRDDEPAAGRSRWEMSG